MTKYEVSTLKKGLHILELVKQHEGITLKEVTDQLSLSKSTAFRLLATLEDMSYVYKLQNQYFINHKMFCESFERRSAMDWVSLRSIYQVAKNSTNGHICWQNRRYRSCDDTNITCTICRIS